MSMAQTAIGNFLPPGMDWQAAHGFSHALASLFSAVKLVRCN